VNLPDIFNHNTKPQKTQKNRGENESIKIQSPTCVFSPTRNPKHYKKLPVNYLKRGEPPHISSVSLYITIRPYYNKRRKSQKTSKSTKW